MTTARAVDLLTNRRGRNSRRHRVSRTIASSPSETSRPRRPCISSSCRRQLSTPMSRSSRQATPLAGRDRRLSPRELAAEYSNGEFRLVFNSGSRSGQTVFPRACARVERRARGELSWRLATPVTDERCRGSARAGIAARRRHRDGQAARSAGPTAVDDRTAASAGHGAGARKRNHADRATPPRLRRRGAWLRS